MAIPGPDGCTVRDGLFSRHTDDINLLHGSLFMSARKKLVSEFNLSCIICNNWSRQPNKKR